MSKPSEKVRGIFEAAITQPVARKTRLQILRDADYVIPKTCGFCMFSEMIERQKSVTDMAVRCSFLKQKVNLFGACKNFLPNPPIMKALVRGLDRAFFERRRFTRNNRHKAPTTY